MINTLTVIFVLKLTMNVIFSIMLMSIQLLFLLGLMLGLGYFFCQGRENASNEEPHNKTAAFGAFALILLLFISFCAVGLRLCIEVIEYVFAIVVECPWFAFAMLLVGFGWRVVQRRRKQRRLGETRRAASPKSRCIY